MKKIVSVLALSALVAGSVFAEASVTGAVRLGTNLFKVTKAGDADTVFGFNDMYKGSWNDDMTFTFSGEKAGVKVVTQINAESGDFGMKNAFGWMHFGDSFTLYGGTQDNRGFTKATNPFDGKWSENYCGYGKPGIHKDLKFGVDAGNVTANDAGSRAVNFMGEYAINDNMNARLVLFRNSNASDDGKTFNMGKNPFAGFTGAAQFNMKQDKFVLTFTAKVFGQEKNATNTNKTSFALFVNPIVVKGLDLLVGYTFANKDSFDDVAKNSAHGIDVRAAYKTGAITLSTLNNITIYDSNLYSWHTVGFAYKVSDLLSAVGIQAKINSGATAWNADDADTDKKATMNFRPYVDLTVQKDCLLSIGVDVGVSKFQGDGDSTIAVTVPVVFYVKL